MDSFSLATLRRHLCLKKGVKGKINALVNKKGRHSEKDHLQNFEGLDFLRAVDILECISVTNASGFLPEPQMSEAHVSRLEKEVLLTAALSCNISLDPFMHHCYLTSLSCSQLTGLYCFITFLLYSKK